MMDTTPCQHALFFARVARLSVLLVMGSAAAQDEFPLEAMTDGDIETLSLNVDDFQLGVGSDIQWSRTLTHTNSKYLRIRFNQFQNPDDEDYRILIKDGSGAIAVEYSSDALPADDFWTPLVFGANALVQVAAASQLQSLSFVIEEIAFQTDGGGWLSVILPDDREPIINYVDNEKIWEVSRSVAKLSFFKGGFFVCTGFMISADQMMTNHHCVATEPVCATTTVLFGYEENAAGFEDVGEQYSCNRVVASNREKDYAVIELNNRPGDVWGAVQLDSRDVADDEEIYIVQHPKGEAKQISLKKCNVNGAIVNGRGVGTDMGHVCDTLGGSSGSPVFAITGEVIGLHHFGIGQDTFWDRNRAIRIKLVMDEIGLSP